MIRCEDWRNAAPEALEALYRLERARWMSRLHWDVEPSHRLLEHARATGIAPGLLALDAGGRAAGWAFYTLHHRMLQIGGLVAASGEVTRALLDAILRSPEADMAADLLCFAFPSSPALESALARQRFAVTRYLYLVRTLRGEAARGDGTAPGHAGRRDAAVIRAGGQPARPDGLASVSAAHDGSAAEPWRLRSGMPIAHWHERDALATVRLLARAYVGVPSARCFAPRGTLEEWATYLAQLIKMPACGTFLPRASLSATEPGHDAPRGVVLATLLQADTAHIAQLIVEPTLRRRGVARDLIETSCALAADAGCARVTLLVAEGNTAACDLYAAAGFETLTHFVHATRHAPTRMRGALRPAAVTTTRSALAAPAV